MQFSRYSNMTSQQNGGVQTKPKNLKSDTKVTRERKDQLNNEADGV